MSKHDTRVALDLVRRIKYGRTLFNQSRHRQVRLLDCKRHQKRRRSNNICSTFRIQRLSFQSFAHACLCMGCHNHYQVSLSNS